MTASTTPPLHHLAFAAALACLSIASAPAWAQREAASRTAQGQFKPVKAEGATTAAHDAGAETTPALKKAAWITYRCNGGRTLKVRYHHGEAIARAQVQADGRTTTMMYSPESNADMAVFAGGGLNWSIENLPPARRRQAQGGMLMRPGMQVVNGQKMAVSEILRKGCDPVR